MLLTFSAGRALKEQGQFGSYRHCLHGVLHHTQLGGLTYKEAVPAPQMVATMANGQSHQRWGDVVPLYLGEVL